jgi:hypothetical protein
MNGELKSYVESELANGASIESIRTELEINNWPQEEINKIFTEIGESNISQTDSVSIEKYELPKWVKILFRFHAIVFLVGTILFGTAIIYSVTTTGLKLLSIFTGPMILIPSIITTALFVFVLIIMILEVVYGISVYKFKRWVLPVTLTLSFSSILVGLLNIMNFKLADSAELIGSIIGVAFMSLISYIGIKYRNAFEGPARKLLVQIPLLLFLLPFIVFATLNQIFIDDSQLNDSDLVLDRIEILKESENAHYSFPVIDDFSEQQKQQYESALAFAKKPEVGESFDSVEAIDHLKNVENITDSFIEASDKRAYQCPSVTNEYGAATLLCSLNSIRDLAVLMSMRAGVEAELGNSDQAIETSMAIVRMGSLLSNAEQPITIEYLVGIALLSIGMDSLDKVLEQSSSTTIEKLERAASELEGYKLDGSSFATSLQRNYMSMKEDMKPFENFAGYVYHHNKTTNDLVEYTRKQITVAVAGCGTDYSNTYEQLNTYVEEEKKELGVVLLISPNSIGEILNSVVISSAMIFRERECELNELNQLLQGKLKEKTIVDDRGWQNYNNEEYGYKFNYPTAYEIQEQEEANSVEVFFTKYDHLRNQLKDCGGYVLQDDEVNIRISLYEGNLSEIQAGKESISVKLGQNQFQVATSRGMCGNSNVYRSSVDESHYIQISVRDSNSLLLKEAEEIISTIKIAGKIKPVSDTASSPMTSDIKTEGDEGGSLQAIQTAPYAVAKTQNVPYLCRYDVISFWEEMDYFEAKILGDDFYSEQVPSPIDLERQEKYGIDPMAYAKFVKKEGWAYLWMKPQEESLDSAGYKFKYDEVKNFIKSQDSSFTHFQYPGLLIEPSPDDECERIETAGIVTPSLQFVDVTENIKSGEVSLEPVVTTSTGTTN